MSQEKKLPPFLFSMQPHSWQRVEARKFSASAQTMMFHFVGFLFGFHKTEAKISYSILQEYSGLSRPTVIRACKELVDGGLITHRVENNISIFGVVFFVD
jgi:CRP-like cAMP-binding protein